MVDAGGRTRLTSSGNAWRSAVAGGAALVLLLLVVGVAARSGSYTSSTAPPAASTTAPATPGQYSPPTRTPDRTTDAGPARELPRSTAVGDAVLVAVLVAAAVGAGAAARWALHRRRRGRTPAASPPAAPRTDGAVPDAVRSARLLVAQQPEARDAVVQAWLLLQEAAADAGCRIRPAETATEYSARLGAAFHLPERPLDQLAHVYRVARFSDHAVGDEHRAEAAAALDALVDALGAR